MLVFNEILIANICMGICDILRAIQFGSKNTFSQLLLFNWMTHSIFYVLARITTDSSPKGMYIWHDTRLKCFTCILIHVWLWRSFYYWKNCFYLQVISGEHCVLRLPLKSKNQWNIAQENRIILVWHLQLEGYVLK